MSNQPTGDKNGSDKDQKQAAQSGNQPQVDVELTNEVAEATQSSPKTENNFTDEGATGNND